MQPTLVLDHAFRPHRVVSWQTAVTMLFGDKVEVVESYDNELRAVSIVIKMPAVVRLLSRVRGEKRAVRFSRLNVLTRDRYACQYCGRTPGVRHLNYDHVVPRSLGGKTTWTNIVMACFACNGHKANRTPEQAGMQLRRAPVKPTSLPIPMLRLDPAMPVPDRWANYLYWGGALEQD
ncbi:MAG: HNH endonuclease [Dehalococcoidia bacterium]|nr:HNH endonuclease [Dehalococcoidia bacterium]